MSYYEKLVRLKDKDFKQLVGVKQEIFNEIQRILNKPTACRSTLKMLAK